MKTLTAQQRAHTISDFKKPIWVVEIKFSNASVFTQHQNDVYFASAEVTDIVSPPANGVSWFPVLQQETLSAVSHTLDPISGVSTIGGVSFSLVDVDSIVSNIMASAGALGYGINRQIVDVYLMYAGDAWADAVRMRRTQLSSAMSNQGVWKFTCKDALNSIKKNIFNPHKGTFVWDANHAGNIVEAATGKLILDPNPVVGTFQIKISRVREADFPFAWGLSFIRIDDEVFRVNKRVRNMVSGVFFSYITLEVSRTNFDWTGKGLPASHANGSQVSEVVNIVANPFHVFRGLLTGWGLYTNNGIPFNGSEPAIFLLDGTSISDISANTLTGFHPNGTKVNGVSLAATLPKHWVIGFNWNYLIDQNNWADVSGAASPVVFDFLFDKSLDAKLFIEREVLRPLGLFMVVSGDGLLKLKVYKDLFSNNDVPPTAVSNGEYLNRVLDEDVAVSWSDVEPLRAGDIITTATLLYDRVPRLGGEFSRSQVFVDTTANAKHGDGRDFVMRSAGIYAGDTDSIEKVFTKVKRVLSRFANPPLRLKVHALGTTTPWEVGDIVRAKLPIADPARGGALNRCFEIVQTSLSPATGLVNYSLVAQSDEPDVQTFRLHSSFADSVFLNNQTLAAVTANAGAALNIIDMATWGVAGSSIAISGDWYLPSANAGTIFDIKATLFITDTVRIFSNAELVFTGDVSGVGGASLGAPALASSGGLAGDAVAQAWYRSDTSKHWYGGGCDAGTYTAKTAHTSVIGAVGQTLFSDSRMAIDVTPTVVVGNLATQLDGVPTVATGGNGSHGASPSEAAYAAALEANKLVTGFWSNNVAWATAAYALAGGTAGAGGAGLVVVARKLTIHGGIDLRGTEGGAGSTTTSPATSSNFLVSCDNHVYVTATSSAGGAGGGGSVILIAEADPTKGVSRTGAAINVGAIGDGGGIIREVLL